MPTKPYTLITDLVKQADVPENGILSRTLQNDDKSKVILFAFADGQELTAHTAPMPAVIYLLEGSAEVTLGEDVMNLEGGTLIHMTPNLRHGIRAKGPVKMMLILLKDASPASAAHQEPPA